MLPTMDLHKELRNGGTEEFISQDRAGGLKQENFSSLTIFFFILNTRQNFWVNYRLPEKCLIQNQKAITPEGKNARVNFMITSTRCKKT